MEPKKPDRPKRFMAVSDDGVRYEITPIPEYVEVEQGGCIENRIVSYALIASDGRQVRGTSDANVFEIIGISLNDSVMVTAEQTIKETEAADPSEAERTP